MPHLNRSRGSFVALAFFFTPFVCAAQETVTSPAAVASNLPPLFPASNEAPPPRDVSVWGYAELRGYVIGDQVAPNGQEYNALFRLDLDFNLWVWRSQRVYAFADAQFWGQRAAPGITNSSQGVFDFSKREYDLTTGLAWNYTGPFEARAFAYSFNNLNRGYSATTPSGYADGVGLENRYYLNSVYTDLGTDAFDIARATFVSVGFYPTKDMVDSLGVPFKPGPFARANLTYDLYEDKCFWFGDLEFIATKSFTPKLLTLDTGVAFRPWSCPPRLEFRIGTSEVFDVMDHNLESTVYAAVRIGF